MEERREGREGGIEGGKEGEAQPCDFIWSLLLRGNLMTGCQWKRVEASFTHYSPTVQLSPFYMHSSGSSVHTGEP